MDTNAVLLSYIASFVVAVLLLYWFGQAKWYWHALSFAAAVGIGIMPPLSGWSGPAYDLAVGSLFIVFLVWGLGEPVYDAMRLPHHHARHRHS